MAQFYPYFGNSLHQAEVIELYETIRDSNLLDDQNKANINDKIGTSVGAFPDAERQGKR